MNLKLNLEIHIENEIDRSMVAITAVRSCACLILSTNHIQRCARCFQLFFLFCAPFCVVSFAFFFSALVVTSWRSVVNPRKRYCPPVFWEGLCCCCGCCCCCCCCSRRFTVVYIIRHQLRKSHFWPNWTSCIRQCMSYTIFSAKEAMLLCSSTIRA